MSARPVNPFDPVENPESDASDSEENLTEETPAEKRSRKINFIWKISFLAYLLGVGALIIYWEVNNYGLPGMICEWQARTFAMDKCYVAINVLGTYVPFALALIPIRMLVTKLTGVDLRQYGQTRFF